MVSIIRAPKSHDGWFVRRIQSSAQWGKQIDNFFRLWGAGGCATADPPNFSESKVRRFYGMSLQTDSSDFHLNMGVPVTILALLRRCRSNCPEVLGRDLYRHADHGQTRGYINLTGKVRPRRPGRSMVRHMSARSNNKAVDGNPTATQPCAAPTTRCFALMTTQLWQMASTGVPIVIRSDRRCAGADRPDNNPLGHEPVQPCRPQYHHCSGQNQFMVGTSSTSGVTRFGASAEWARSVQTTSQRAAGYFSGPSGTPISIGPVSLRAPTGTRPLCRRHIDGDRTRFSISGGAGSIMQASTEDQIGTALNGSHTFSASIVMIGGTYRSRPELTAYAGYSEANRAPTRWNSHARPRAPLYHRAFLIAIRR